MKLTCVLLFLVFQTYLMPLFGQQAYDGSVMIGGRGVIGVFKEDGTKTFSLVPNIQAQFNDGFSSISDTNGKLIIASNVHKIFDGEGNLMEGGSGITPPKISQADYRPKWTQASIILPVGNDIYHVFTTTMSDKNWEEYEQQISFIWDLLTYHTVDMKQNDGKGKVIKSNQVLMKDAVLSYNRMTAVKHANGRDWWLVKPHMDEHLFYTFLVSPTGITGPFEQKVDLPKLALQGGVGGQSVFTQQGDKYAYCVDYSYGVYVLDFDRCAGTFRPYHYFPLNPDSSIGWRFTGGTNFSPNGKLLYINNGYEVYQLDLADTSKSSLQLIHGPDSDSINPFFPLYINIRAGADDKLYMSYYHNTRSTISYIDKPNLRGQACNFCQQCLTIPNQNASGLPNMPYYHLGALERSGCDTLNEQPASNPPIWEEIKVYPNPVNSGLTVFLPLQAGVNTQLEVYNSLGQLILKQNKTLNARQELIIDISSLTVGIYHLRIAANGQIWNEKILKE